MTVHYTDTVSRSTTWNFFKLLFRWKGSLWKVIWAELLLWLAVCTLLSLIYRLCLSCSQRDTFEKVVQFWSQYTGGDYVPLTFILGFFVSLVMNRWWSMFQSIGNTETVATLVASYIDGNDEETVTIKRNIVRYMVLTQAMVFIKISFCARKLYPDMKALKHAGFINTTELQAMEETDSSNPKEWLPIYWALSLIKQLKKDKKIESDSDSYVIDLSTRLCDYKASLKQMSNYIHVPIPLAYTQVVFLAVRLYFLIALMANQYLNPNNVNSEGIQLCPHNTTAGASVSSTSTQALDFQLQFEVDLYFPFGTVVQFLFYVGWVKVAEALFNPFGGEDDDFDVTDILAEN